MSGEWTFDLDGTQVTVTRVRHVVDGSQELVVKCRDFVAHWPLYADFGDEDAATLARASAELTYRKYVEVTA